MQDGRLSCKAVLQFTVQHLFAWSRVRKTAKVMPLSLLTADVDETDWEAVVDDSNPPSFSQVDLARSEQEVQTQYPLFPVSSRKLTCSNISL